ncbi:hypothetical protein BEWA_050570 [Theileria equi strain WA]|uniref:Signal peptide containing protein n=1 Tax=Theileria equi strain WA TaxID=1537102 RepID=L1LBE1_THEEQ|nr:hypothetical protein BEWA_050570 [Theileria equi strain WA]EKX72589.1 hypothetical protein BEWA_050570 [Theileria equi strain WA]|eukprot:XP_004832041.1 hypothetical protein BEWA_050570 [Theileria equi strain WA]
MRIFALVYLVAILGFHKVQCDGLSMDDQSLSMEGTSQGNDYGPLVPQPENQGVGQERSEASGLALDVVNLDSSNFTLFECNDNGNEIIFVIPRNDVSVDMVVCGETTIWTPGEDEEFEYAKLFLKDGEPRIVFIAKSKDSTATGRWYARNGDVWENCKDTYQEKIKAIREEIPRTNSFILNLEEDKDTEECTIFDAKLIGAPMRLYFAKPEYSAEEVMYNRTSIWKGSKDELCTACDLYFNKGELSFLILSVKENDVIRYEYFETRGKEWKTMTSEEFNNRRKEAQTTHGNFDVQEESAKKEKKRSKRNALGQLFSRNKEQESTYSQSHKQSSSQEENAESERSQEGEHATVSSGQDGIILDLSQPDETKLDVYAETKSEVTVKAYTPKDWLHISSVMDAGATVWKSSGDEKCTFVESYAKGGVELLYLETSGGTMSKYFEKVDGQWNEIDEELFYEKARTFIGESGKDASLDLASPSRLLCKSFEYSFAGNAIRLIVPNKGVTVSKLLNGTEEVYTLSSEEEFDHTKVYLNKDGKPELASVTLKTSSGVSHKAYSKNGGGWTFCADSETKMKGLRTSATFKSNFTMDISSVTSTKECTVFEVYLLGVTTRHFYPKPGYVSIKVKDGDKRLWTFINPSDACLFCFIYKRDNKEVLEMAVVNGILRRWKFFERVDGNEWKKVDKGKFLGKLKEIREPENPVSIFASKVDLTLFNVVGSVEENVKVLKLTVKYGVKATELKYDDKEVWSGKARLSKSSSVVEALLYFDENAPVLVAIRAVKGGKESTVYRYYDGSKWKDDKEDDHKNKLETLKEGLKPTTTSSSSSSIALDLANPDQSKVLVYDRSGNGIKSKNYSPKDGHHISSVVDGGMSIWNATGDERCTLVKLSTRGDSSLLLMSLESAKKCFEKVNGAWNEVDETQFDKMEEMKGGVIVEASQDNTSSESIQSQSGQTNQQESYDTQTSSQSVNIPEDQDPMTDNSEGNDTVDADSSITPDDTVREASEGEVESKKEDDREYKEPISVTEDLIQNSEKSMPSENAALEEANYMSSDQNPVDPSKLDENGAGSSESSTDGQSNEVSTDGFSDRAKEMMEGEQEIPEVKLQTVEDNNTTGVSDSTSSTQEDKKQSGVSDTQSSEGSVNEPQNGSTVESTNPFEPSKPDDELKGEEELPEASESTPGIMDKIKNFKSSAISSVFSSNKNQESNNTADSSNDSKNSSKQSKLKKTFSGLGNKAKNIMNSKQ